MMPVIDTAPPVFTKSNMPGTLVQRRQCLQIAVRRGCDNSQAQIQTGKSVIFRSRSLCDAAMTALDITPLRLCRSRCNVRKVPAGPKVV
jgi:hypothetical protein